MFNSNRRLGTALLVALDVLLINLAFALAYWLRYRLQLFLPVEPEFFAPFLRYVPMAALLTVIALATYGMSGLYRQRRGRRWFDEVGILTNGTMTTIVLVMSVTFLATYLASRLVYSRLMFIEAALLIVLFLSIARLARRIIRARLRRRGIGISRALIVGAGEVARGVMSTIVGDPTLGYAVAGFVDDHPERGNTDIGRFKALGGLDRFHDLLREQEIDEVIVTLPWSAHDRMTRIVDQCERENVTVRIVPDMFQLSLSRVDVDSLGGIPVLRLREPSLRRGTLLTKRVLDLLITPLLILLGSVFLGLIALAVKLDSPGPVIYRQRRVGKDGREFDMLKFRSMIKDADQRLEELRDLNEADGPLFKMRDD
jgi:FlaA1/EpsC-like NDP-sugar epimerase